MGIALACLLWRGWWRRVPVFGLYLAAQMPLLIGYRPESAAWLSNFWIPLAPLIVLLRVAVAIEAFRLHAVKYRWLMGLSLAALALALVGVIWRVVPAAPQPRIVELRRYAQIWAGLFLLLYAVLAYSADHWQTGWKARHLLVLLVILLNHTIVSMMSMEGPWRSGWWTVSDVSFAVSAAGYLAWAILCPLSGSPGPQAR